MNAVDIGRVQPGDQTQSPFDLFLVFAGANIVATTFQTGASLVPAFSLGTAAGLILLAALFGSALIALLSQLGPRLGVPSIIAARAALGLRGAALVALLLYVSNFAWIAVNNVIAASACAEAVGGPSSQRLWALGLGLLSTAIVAGGPRIVALADRLAVPLLFGIALVLTVACLRLPWNLLDFPGNGSIRWVNGLDIVMGYQMSWVLMFADYSRYTASARRAATAVFLGLTLTTLWMMPLGAVAARAAGSADPGLMMRAVGLGAWGAVLMTVATLTTNFVNIYISALALRSLAPRLSAQVSIWSTGLVGTALGLLSATWLEQYAGFMMVLGGTLIPVGGVFLARFFLVRRPVEVATLYDETALRQRTWGFDVAGLAAWMAGSAAYFATARIGGTLPSLVTSVVVYVVLRKDRRRP